MFRQNSCNQRMRGNDRTGSPLETVPMNYSAFTTNDLGAISLPRERIRGKHGNSVRAVVFFEKKAVEMNDGGIIGKVHSSMYHQIQKAGMAVPVQVLMDLGYLSVSDYESWWFGRVDYLERVCKANLRKLTFIMKEIRAYARKNNLKPSWTYYKQWGRKGKKPAVKLRFSKSGDENIERNYATHYIPPKRIAEINRPSVNRERD